VFHVHESWNYLKLGLLSQTKLSNLWDVATWEFVTWGVAFGKISGVTPLV